MRFELGRYGIRIIPDDARDEAYLEEVLGLRRAGDNCLCLRQNAIGLSCWAYAEITKPTHPAPESPNKEEP